MEIIQWCGNNDASGSESTNTQATVAGHLKVLYWCAGSKTAREMHKGAYEGRIRRDALRRCSGAEPTLIRKTYIENAMNDVNERV